MQFIVRIEINLIYFLNLERLFCCIVQVCVLHKQSMFFFFYLWFFFFARILQDSHTYIIKRKMKKIEYLHLFSIYDVNFMYFVVIYSHTYLFIIPLNCKKFFMQFFWWKCVRVSFSKILKFENIIFDVKTWFGNLESSITCTDIEFFFCSFFFICPT